MPCWRVSLRPYFLLTSLDELHILFYNFYHHSQGLVSYDFMDELHILFYTFYLHSQGLVSSHLPFLLNLYNENEI